MINNQDSLRTFLSSLTGKLFKILPLYEEENVHLSSYIHSLSIQAEGFASICELASDPDYLSLLGTLNGMQKQVELSNNRKTVKREVFKMINISKQLDSSFRKEGV